MDLGREGSVVAHGVATLPCPRTAERFVWKTLALKASVLYLLLFEKSRLLNRLFCFHRRFKIILLEKD